MAFSDYAQKSISNFKVLIEIDIGKSNTQWVNIGSGIWYLNFDALYPEVGPAGDDLLNGFTVQTFANTGSVQIDGLTISKFSTLLEITNSQGSYFSNDDALYICFPRYDEPILHQITIGIPYGVSFDDFVPIGSNRLYEGRLIGDPIISINRDPLYFGKLQFDSGNISLINTDGYFDTFPTVNNIYGNQVRIKIGFSELNVNDYLTLYTGNVESLLVNEETMEIVISDKRKQLTKSIQFTCNYIDALTAIERILANSYNVVYGPSYYDTTAWEIARATVPLVYIDIYEYGAIKDSPVIDIIQDICISSFGLFIVTSDNKYTFKMIDTSATAFTTILSCDILNSNSINYDPSQVISSIKVGYDKTWEEGYESPYQFYIDTSRESASFLAYKVYNQQTIYTLLKDIKGNLTDFVDKFLDYYSGTVHGIGTITTSLKYYDVEIGDIINIEINRLNSTMLGTKKCEVIGVSYRLSQALIDFTYRVI